MPYGMFHTIWDIIFKEHEWLRNVGAVLLGKDLDNDNKERTSSLFVFTQRELDAISSTIYTAMPRPVSARLH